MSIVFTDGTVVYLSAYYCDTVILGGDGWWDRAELQPVRPRSAASSTTRSAAPGSPTAPTQAWQNFVAAYPTLKVDYGVVVQDESDTGPMRARSRPDRHVQPHADEPVRRPLLPHRGELLTEALAWRRPGTPGPSRRLRFALHCRCGSPICPLRRSGASSPDLVRGGLLWGASRDGSSPYWRRWRWHACDQRRRGAGNNTDTSDPVLIVLFDWDWYAAVREPVRHAELP